MSHPDAGQPSRPEPHEPHDSHDSHERHELYERDACAHSHGITVDEVRPGYARARMTVRPDMVNGHEIGHGGITFLLADTALAYASNAAGHAAVAAAATINFLAPARLGDVLVAECGEVHTQGRTGLYDVTVRTGDGTVVAVFRGQTTRVRAAT